ncbi:flagellar assembly peptidoglycan hydrolase FlgJ [Alcaligenaceae bacterium CGII-47]|nr:flagellar assembly peptidoglycan hydrolase FlgJ [Alcaligenaceae bacterium CGII-47]
MDFIASTPRPTGEMNAMDFSSLNSLKHGVQAGANASLADQKAVAQQFEAMFIQMMLKQARQSSDMEPTLFDSSATRMARSLQDEQSALQLADPGLGLARALLDQIRGGRTDQLDSTAQPPELAASRLPGLRSRIGEGRREVADSITALIGMLSQRNVAEKVSSAIRGAPSHIHDFVSKMSAAADFASQQSGVPAKLILSQAALESGWGQRELMREDGRTSHNLFGIKATGGWKGEVVYAMTTEFEGGVAHKVQQPFRAYDSYADSFADYARLIGRNERYSEVLTAPSAEVAAQRIQEAGYATDPSYADKLISIMGYFNARATQ